MSKKSEWQILEEKHREVDAKEANLFLREVSAELQEGRISDPDDKDAGYVDINSKEGLYYIQKWIMMAIRNEYMDIPALARYVDHLKHRSEYWYDSSVRWQETADKWRDMCRW